MTVDMVMTASCCTSRVRAGRSSRSDYERKYLLDENKFYDHLRLIQGGCIPVCLGIVELPYYYDAGIYSACSFSAGLVVHFTGALPRRMKVVFWMTRAKP